MIYYKCYEMCASREWAVFVHGAGGSSSIWYKQIREFKKHFNILLIDLRGHGKSKDTKKLMQRYSFLEVSSDIIEVLNHLKISSAHFIGMSLGSIVIRNIAEAEPERIKTMVLGGAVLRLNTRIKTLMTVGHIAKRIIPYMWLYQLFAWCLMPKKSHEKSRLLFVNQAKKLCQKEFIKWFKLTRDVVPLLAYFEQRPVNIPTLYVMGKEDYMFLLPVERAVEKCTHSTLTVIEDSGHVCNVDQPEKFNEITIQFLRKQSGAA
ncbi:alpha/beta fold hydrolase [Peribacillus sp. SCS-155]|uniref:alpha/beta fold hydrolase n=1 Tax=Peribacillus sedimenti TaxID=3115297 RepID=UPI0039061091